MASLSRRAFALALMTTALAVASASRGLGADAPAQAGAPPTRGVDPYTLVDPELRAGVTPGGATNAEARKALRDQQASASGPPPVMRVIPGPRGAPDVRVFIDDRAPGGKLRPAYVHMHGGGYVSGSPSNRPGVSQQCGCVVVSVDYRLAPKTPFPGSLEDNYAALKWVHANADALGIDPKKIAIGGESAGGGHAAALAIAARDRGEVPVLFQVLVYPMIDDRTGSTRPAPPHIGTYVWTAESNRSGWSALLGQPAGSPKVPSGAVPARIDNLAGLPPAWIGVGALDLFVQENIEYARRLVEVGVPVQLEVVPGAYHGFDLFVPNAAASRRFTESWQAALRRAFAK